MEEEPDPSYVSFSGTPGYPDGGEMEATVTELVFDAYNGSSSSATSIPITDWVEMPPEQCANLLDGRPLSGGRFSSTNLRHDGLCATTYEVDVTPELLTALLSHGKLSQRDHVTAFSLLVALRADSPDAPSTYPEAVARGGGWPAAIAKELDNHASNGSWTLLPRSALPYGRRLHKMVWVFKVKRDGTCKGRLCVQGCTLEAGVDYDQTFSATLRHASARGLFAFAARKGCRVRSVDWVAAYLQGEFEEGEVVYCHVPAGADLDADGKPNLGPDGKPRICRIDKPIYGLPQSGRRLQRCVFPWCTDVMGLRQLDDSDGCVFVFDDPDGVETFAVGIYVDNLQIVHSAELDANGKPLDSSSYYAKFMAQLRKDWDVVDEGPMDDLLGMECRRDADGSITLHQTKYVHKLLERFAPNISSKSSVSPLPFSEDLPRLVLEALDGSSASEPAYPELIKPCQQQVGALMYLCVSTRPDLAYAVHQHCRAMSRPTPALMRELQLVFAYLARNPSLGIRFSAGTSNMTAYADASWEVRHSTSGWVVFWQNAPLIWGSRKQQSIALSSCEAEIIALSEAAKDVVYVRKFLRGLDKTAIDGPSDCATDSKSARDLSYNPEHHGRTKHVERRHFYIRDMVEKLELRVPLVATVNNYADFFTKPLKSKAFFGLRDKIMNVAHPCPSCGGTGRVKDEPCYVCRP